MLDYKLSYRVVSSTVDGKKRIVKGVFSLEYTSRSDSAALSRAYGRLSMLRRVHAPSKLIEVKLSRIEVPDTVSMKLVRQW